MINWNNIAETEPAELLETIKKDFTTKLPVQVESVEDLQNAQKLLSKLASQYSFLIAVAVEIKGIKRRMKRDKEPKEKIDDMMEREEILTAYCESVKMNYNAVSRMITIRQQIYDEYKMDKYVK